ncbi:MAG: hypothetical protein JW941_08475 [Candidatus Coatesbacteria bacterium]|nr:hypothetical protein [Candidatus Coatesbacteria bacterium]
MIVDNGFERIRLENVEIKLKVSQSVNLASIESAELSSRRVEQGDSVRLDVDILPFEGKKKTLAFDIPIPLSCKTGAADLLLFDADAYQMWEYSRARTRFRANSFADVVDMLVEAPNHRQLLVVLAKRDQLTMRGREPLRELPASAREVLSSAASSKALDKANFEVLAKLAFDTEFNLSGGDKLRIEIKPKKY